MQAFMPQKDTAFLLAQAARSFITASNAARADGRECGILFPRFPLFAFADDLPQSGYTSCRILAPAQEGGRFFFPVELVHGTDCAIRPLQIVFAQAEERTAATCGGGETGPQPCEQPHFEGEERFPLRLRVFRTGRIEFSGNSWEVWDERWQKLPS